VTGANLAVAASGRVVIVENEGNIRLATTCPKTHIAVMGIEKVVADHDDMAAVLRVLVRSATAQDLPGYVSMLPGPRPPDEADGPERFHLVLLDNGRGRIAADPELRETLLCLRCGACLNVCPVFQTVGGQCYGWPYSGPIGALLAPQLLGRAARDLPAACTGCGACAEVCPVKIDIPKLLLLLRRRMASGPLWRHPLSFPGSLGASVWSAVCRQYGLYRAAMALGFALRPLGPRLARLPGLGFLGRALAAMPEPQPRFAKRWAELAREIGQRRRRP